MSESEYTGKLGELKQGVYMLEQGFNDQGEPTTTLYPVRKRWWWFGQWVPDREKVEHLGERVSGE